MIIFRNVKSIDVPAIYKLSETAGITTLPKNLQLLEERVAWAEESFQIGESYPGNRFYLFVLEDLTTNTVVGTAGILSNVGSDAPFYSYKLSKQTHYSPMLDMHADYEELSLVNDHKGKSEICTLFLSPQYRTQHFGSLLSRARFLFIAHFPNLFAQAIIAEVRGVVDEKGHSPFWKAIGKHFFKISFRKADELSFSTDKHFIADLMPPHPIPVPILSRKAQAVIGKPHSGSAPAMKILLNEGFYYDNYVDIFDAGPTVEAKQKQIYSIQASKLVTISAIKPKVSGEIHILANTKLNFKAILGEIELNAQNECVLNSDAAELLAVETGETIRIIPYEKFSFNQPS